MRKILITGAGGQLGRAIFPLVRRTWPQAELTLVSGQRLEAGGARLVSADLRTEQGWQTLAGGYGLVFHLAAVIPAVDGTLADFDDNAAMARHLCALAPAWGTRQIVYSSSISLYPWEGKPLRETSVLRPGSYYAAGKLAGEALLSALSASGVHTASLRLSSLYGQGRQPRLDGTVLYRFLHLALAGQPLTLFGQGRRTQDFIHEDDAARLFLQAARLGAQGVFNAGSGRATSMLALARAACHVAGRSPELIRLLPDKPEGASVRVDMRTSQSSLDWRPLVSLKEGLAHVLR